MKFRGDWEEAKAVIDAMDKDNIIDSGESGKPPVESTKDGSNHPGSEIVQNSKTAGY